ncbi:mucin-3A [Scaptodrosophila lebanonensis]|uniref:Mucin-3A n=1 Tax=Drosophila lebanonensis TaxID=7225 RepID=A0A6J2U0E6_DROLE|nr:mucin-3A [Scaptodrosophila lebanonensis]
MDAQFEHLCRICAANTKSRNNSVAESVFIFKTVGLKDKIERYLYLNVSEHDPLPKVLCKSCYRQVEATASLSNIAKHTQRVFRDFLLSTVPKHARESTAALLTGPATSEGSISVTSGSNNSNNNNHGSRDDFRPIVLTRAPETTIALAPQEPDDVLSLNKKDSNIRQQQQHPQQQHPKQQQQQQHHHQQPPQQRVSTNLNSCINMNNLMLPPRRNSVFVDTRYGSAPMSIAQRSMQQPPSLVPLKPEVTLSKASKPSTDKKSSPAGVINFIQTHGRVTGNAVSISSNAGNQKAGNAKSSSSSSASSASTARSTVTPPTISSIGVPNLPNSVLQQKRRNLKNTLNNIKAIQQSGQVSLLKSSQLQQPQQRIEEVSPLVTTTVVPHKSLFGGEQSVEEALPEHIIIAAPKKKREEAVLPRSGPPKLQKIGTTPVKPTVLSSAKGAVSPSAGSKDAKSKIPASMSSLTEAISLGNVIRDPDLLKLILKALKWPVTADNCEEQMTRLKNSKFAVIMSDSNLLQDDDLTQLLGPYLGPMLAVAQQQQKQKQSSVPASHSAPTATTPSPAPSPPQEFQNVTDLTSTMPYKLPPETSVQLVPSSPTESEAPVPLGSSSKTISGSKRSQRKSRVRDSSLAVVEDQRNSFNIASTSNAARVTNELLNINAMLIAQFGSNPADALNEALISMLKQQETNDRRQSIRRRSDSTASAGVNLEDIVLIEPQPSLDPEISDPSIEVENITMSPPKIPEPPPITRPIIKRRRTVIHTSKQSENPTTAKEDPLPIPEVCENSSPETEISPNKDTEVSAVISTMSDELIIEKEQVETPQDPTSTVLEATIRDNNKTDATDAHLISDTSTSSGDSPCKSSPVNARKTTVKSALGQKLLEAIGLQQLGKDVAPESSRDSLRSALKRSLKQAQEQQQQLKRVKQEEPVKQLADSTTKTVAGESAEEHKKAIAERELALLKRKAKMSELNRSSIKEEKLERTDVSSSSSRNRRNRKTKSDSNSGETASEEKRAERWDDDDELPLKTESDKASDSGRPTRTSKTMSKYYKRPGSDKALSAQKSHAMGTRSTRQR